MGIERLRKIFRSEEKPEEEIPFVNELNLHPKEIKWIKQVKKASEEFLREYDRDVHPEVHGATAFTIVQAMLIRQRELQLGGFDPILEKQLDMKLEEIIKQLSKSQEKFWGMKRQNLPCMFYYVRVLHSKS